MKLRKKIYPLKLSYDTAWQRNEPFILFIIFKTSFLFGSSSRAHMVDKILGNNEPVVAWATFREY